MGLGKFCEFGRDRHAIRCSKAGTTGILRFAAGEREGLVRSPITVGLGLLTERRGLTSDKKNGMLIDLPCGVWTKPLARRTLPRYVIWQGNCDVAAHTTRSNVAVLRITKAIEYPIRNCPAKPGRLPPNVSIRSDPAIWIPPFPQPSLAGSLQIES